MLVRVRVAPKHARPVCVAEPDREKPSRARFRFEKQVPGFLKAEDDLVDKGVDQVYVYCVNDAAVMTGWAKDQKIVGSIVKFLADTSCALTKALGMELSLGPPASYSLDRERCCIEYRQAKCLFMSREPRPRKHPLLFRDGRTHPGPMGDLGNTRCKRFVLIVDNGKVTHVQLSEAEGDPAGDNDPHGPVAAETMVAKILTLL